MPWPDIGFQEVTAERLTTLPPESRETWATYLTTSDALARADKAAVSLAAKSHGQPKAKPAPKRSGPGPKLGQPPSFYATDEARRTAAAILSFQAPSGGWSKAVSYARPRLPEEHFAVEATYLGTFDNNATIPELRYLAAVVSAPGHDENALPARAGFTKGLRYVFQSQYPNGGFPQIFPLAGSYHDAVTFNDGAMVNILELLRDVAGGQGHFAITTPEERDEAGRRYTKGLACLLESQIRVDGQPTVWSQQHDALTLAACAARNFEPTSQCSAESSGILMFLMSVPRPSPELKASIDAGVRWFKAHALTDLTWNGAAPAGQRLAPAPGASPLWARLYEISTGRPIFGDRDRLIHYSVEEITAERARGYSWFNTTGTKVLDRYTKWLAKQAPTPTGT